MAFKISPRKMGRISRAQKEEGVGDGRHSREGKTLEQWFRDWAVRVESPSDYLAKV